MRHEQNFFERQHLPAEPKLGEPPPYVNGRDTNDQNWAESAWAYNQDVPEHTEIVPEIPTAPDEFLATLLDWDAMESVKPREWIYGHFLIRRFISVLGAPGGTGKTAYAFTVGIAIVTGLELLGEKVHEPGNLWIYNLEDPKDELYRRFNAACRHHGISRSQIEGRVFLDSGRDRPLVIAKATREGGVIAMPVVDLLIEEIQRRNVSVLIVDPFIRSHELEENVNEQIDFAAALWAKVADKANCSIQLVHHFKKGGASGDAAAFRGASSLIDAARSALSLSRMSEDEAKRMGVDVDDCWQYVRVDNAKLNLAPPPASATWLKLIGEDLENQSDGRPSDIVQSVERWEPPSAWDGMPWSMVNRVLTKIDAGILGGEFYAFAYQSKDRWAGNVLMDDACKTPDQAKQILIAWKASGVLEEGQYQSPRRKGGLTGCIRVNQLKLSEMRQADSSRGSPDE